MPKKKDEVVDLRKFYCDGMVKCPDKDIFAVELVDDGKIGENLVCILAKKTHGLKLLEILSKLETIEPTNKRQEKCH